jgi:site-specific recombinase XerD
MCYKEQEQKRLYDKFLDKSAGIPDYIKNYFSYLKSSNTIINNYSTINNFFEYLYNNKTLERDIQHIQKEDFNTITSFHLISYFDSLNIKQSSIITKANILSGFWGYLLEEEIVQKNIVTKKLKEKYKTEKDHEVHAPSYDDVFDLLMNVSEIKNPKVATKYTAIIKLLVGSAIRISELVGLDIDDLYFKDEIPYIKVMRKGKQREKDAVEVSEDAVKAVNEYLLIRNDSGEEKGTAVFLSTWGNRLSEKTIRKELKAHSGNKIKPHKLRDYTATNMYNNGADMLTISKQLGHKSLDTASKHYIAKEKGKATKELNKISI